MRVALAVMRQRLPDRCKSVSWHAWAFPEDTDRIIWGVAKMGDPKNRWFIRENPIEIDDFWRYPHLWKPPYRIPGSPFKLDVRWGLWMSTMIHGSMLAILGIISQK